MRTSVIGISQTRHDAGARSSIEVPSLQKFSGGADRTIRIAVWREESWLTIV
jgi:hypothetical protein